MAQNMIHGSIVSFQPERRMDATGTYGVLDEVGLAPIFSWSGLNTSFGVDVNEHYEEIQYNPVHNTTNNLELVRNVSVAEELPFALATHPQVAADWPLLQYITGSVSALGDEPDSTSWLKELDGKFSLFTGIMFEDYKCEIPGIGVAKESISGFAGHRAPISAVNPALTDAVEDTSKPLVWKDIYEIRMDDSASPSTEISHCLSDISFGFASEITKAVHPESTLSTKICGVRVMSRKMFVSLKLTWVDQSFLDVAVGALKKNIKLVIGPSGNRSTFTFGGLYWPNYIAKADPKELVGATITCVVDQPSFTYSS